VSRELVAVDETIARPAFPRIGPAESTVPSDSGPTTATIFGFDAHSWATVAACAGSS
jgi:hypothetical protein